MAISPLKEDSFVLEPFENHYQNFRLEEYKEYLSKINDEDVISGKATLEGLNYFKSRNFKGNIKSSNR